MTHKKLMRTFLDPKAWQRQLSRWYLTILRKFLWRRLDAALSRLWKLPSKPFGSVVLADGMWDNPNHFVRLRLFLEGIPAAHRQQLVALVRSPDDRALQSLKSIGFTKFFCLSCTPVTEDDYKSAKLALADIQSHGDILKLALPGGIPVDILYDTVLKLAKHPRPPIDSPVWVECMADIFRLHRFYKKVFSTVNVNMLVLSHPWKNEFGAALWQGLSQGVTCFHLNGMYETIRIKRFDHHEDFFSPVEFILGNDFLALPEAVQSNIAKAGFVYLEERTKKGTNTDINQVMAYRDTDDSREFFKRLKSKLNTHVILVCCHVWYDFPHSFGMRNFTDFLDWIESVLNVAYLKDNVTWLIKPHPTESWYGGFQLNRLVKNCPDHVHVLDEKVSVLAAIEMATAVVTVHGTVALEAVARGVPVLCGDKSPYTDWGVATTAASREEFLDLLANVEELKVPDVDQRARAAAFAYLSVSPGDSTTGFLRLPADSVPPRKLFATLNSLVCADQEVMHQQGQLIAEWIKSGTKSFSIYHKINQLNRPRFPRHSVAVGNTAVRTVPEKGRLQRCDDVSGCRTFLCS